MHPRFNGENLVKNKVMYRKFAELALKYNCSPPQLALAWLLNQGDDIVPIPGTLFCRHFTLRVFMNTSPYNGLTNLCVLAGTTKVKNLKDNIGSVNIELSPDDLREISEAVDVDEVYGEKDIGIMSKFYWKYANTPAKHMTIRGNT